MTAAPLPLPVKTRPWAHQVEAYRRAYAKSAFGLFHDMGCGKSASAIALVNAWHAQTVLVVAPLSVLPVWPKQFSLHSQAEYNCVVLGSSMSVKKRMEIAKLELSFHRPTVFIINYESVWREPFASWAMKQLWDTIIVDEGAHLKAPGGKASRFMARLRQCAKHRLALTGTPMPHSPLDVYGLYRFLDPSIFGTSFAKFRARYAVMGGFQGYQVLSYKNQEEMTAKIYSIAHRVMKRDVLDLPPVVTEERYCELSLPETKAYKDLKKEFYTWLAECSAEVSVTNALVRLLRLQQVTSGYLRTDDGREVCIGDTKARAFADWLEDLPLHEPVVVFCRFSYDVFDVKRKAIESGRTVAELSGNVHDELAPWQAGKYDVLVTQIQSGAEGIDLSRACYCLFYSVGFSLGQYAQACARVDRPGQTRPVTLIHLLATHTIDTDVFRALAEKREIVEAILSAARA